MKEVYDFIKKCQTYYLATVDGDQPRVRPFGTIDMFEDKLYIQTGKVKEVSKQLHANPKAELSCFAEGQWLRLEGKLVEDDRLVAKEHMLNSYPELRRMYSPDDGNTEVFFFKDATATLCSFAGEPKIIKL